MNDSRVVRLSELGDSSSGWRGYLSECQNALEKEGRDRGRGWVAVSSREPRLVDVSYRKVSRNAVHYIIGRFHRNHTIFERVT